MGRLQLFSPTISRGCSMTCGALSAALLLAAMPGRIAWWPLLFVALVPLLFTVLYLPPRRALCTGFFFGLLYHIGLLYWIVPVLQQYGGLPFLLAALAMLLLASYMALYPACFCGLLSLSAGRSFYRERSIMTLVWMAPVFWTGLEYLRSRAFSGFPWMDLGYGVASQPVLVQAADLGGHLLLSFLLVLWNGLLIAIISRQQREVRWNERHNRRLALLLVGILVFLGGYSMQRLEQVETQQKRVLQADITLIQGNIAQALKWSEDQKAAIVNRYAQLTRTAQQEHSSELVIWPETALPFDPDHDLLMFRIRDLVITENMYLLTGAPTVALDPSVPGERQSIRSFNSSLLLANDGREMDRYDKQHLVPFGEYVPFADKLPFIQPLVENAGTFTPGASRKPIPVGSLRIGVMICYESIFPDISRQWVRDGANLLVNISNDAWYGRSSAPHHSMAMAVLRAVETRRTVARAANTGISAFIEPSGRVQDATELFTEAAVIRRVPLMEVETFFQRRGYLFGPACLALIPSILLFNRRRTTAI